MPCWWAHLPLSLSSTLVQDDAQILKRYTMGKVCFRASRSGLKTDPAEPSSSSRLHPSLSAWGSLGTCFWLCGCTLQTLATFSGNTKWGPGNIGLVGPITTERLVLYGLVISSHISEEFYHDALVFHSATAQICELGLGTVGGWDFVAQNV